jgi:hypothetical protein
MDMTEIPFEAVVAVRRGDVLLPHTILKSDHFPGCQNMKLTPLIDGAPNFRQIPGLPVYGVAIPTISGLRRVLERLSSEPTTTHGNDNTTASSSSFTTTPSSPRPVLWHNLREEPVIYINGRPFVVREADKPFANLEYTGIDRQRVEEMESRLKVDILEEAAQYGDQILVADEDDQFQVLQHWEPVTEVDVLTPLEVYKGLTEDGYNVEYLRVPITDEKAPKDDDFEALINRCWSPPKGAALVFNCQMGRGRTTTGTVIGALLYLRAQCRSAELILPPEPLPNLPPWFVLNRTNNNNALIATSSNEDGGEGMALGDMMSPRANGGAGAGAAPLSEEEELRSGKYAVVRSLLRALEHGWRGKRVADATIDACSAMQNLREAIAGYRKRIFTEPNDARRQALLQVCIEYLERYFVLVAFAAYLNSTGFSPGSPNHISFAAWTNARPELRSILERLLRADPLKALGLHHSSTNRRSSIGTTGSGSGDNEEGTGGLSSMALSEDINDEMSLFIAQRDGAVLGPRSILKNDHFPGCQSSRLPLLFPGAPNFRAVPGVGVWGGAIPTTDGIRAVLRGIGAAPTVEDEIRTSSIINSSNMMTNNSGSSAGIKGRAVWHLMREEPVVYINGAPYVLREASRPFKNLLEYRGIDTERLESMEERLREDVLNEAGRNGGRVLVTIETSNDGTAGTVGEGKKTSNKSGGTSAASGTLFDRNLTLVAADSYSLNPNPQSQQQQQQNSAIQRDVGEIFIPVSGPEAVATPRQVYRSLAEEGYRVKLVRVPLTDGTAPKPRDFDAFYSSVAGSGPGDTLIYTCQLGGGRTTTGMVIGALLRMFLNGASLGEVMEPGESLQHLDEDVGRGSSLVGGSSDDDDDDDVDEDRHLKKKKRNTTGGGGDDDIDDREEYHVPGVTNKKENSVLEAVRNQFAVSHITTNFTASDDLSGGGGGEGGGGHQKQPSSALSSSLSASILASSQGPTTTTTTTTTDNNNRVTVQPQAPLSAYDLEIKNLRDGEYVAVRRFLRILERGPDAKHISDRVIDECGLLINLRTAIMRYRRPKDVKRFFQPEIQARHRAFQRGCAYLERYCMIIAFAAYLNNCKLHGRRLTFEEWVLSRPDVSAAREFIHQNPAGALAPLPPVIPSVLSSASNGGGIRIVPSGDGHTISSLQPSSTTKAGGKVRGTAAREVAVSQEEERSVLLRRRGSTVGRRSILKSLTFNAGSSSSSTSLFNNQRTAVAAAAVGGVPPSTPPPATINPPTITSTSPVIAIPSPGIVIPSLSLPVQGNTAVAKHTDGPPINTTIVTTTKGIGAITNTENNNSNGKPTGSSLLHISGIADIRCAQDLPIYSVGNATVEGLCSLLLSLGAGPISFSSREGEGDGGEGDGGEGDGDMHDTITIATTTTNYHVIVTDLREELVLYINGTAFIRRELEMPAAALHHAGIQATRLEDLERRLLADVAAESEGWGGKILLHREVVVLPTDNSSNSEGGNNNNNNNHNNNNNSSSSHTASPLPSNQGTEMAPPVSPALGGLFSPGPYPHINSTTSPKDKKDEEEDEEEEEEEDITQTTEAQEKTKPAVQVVAFWEPVVVPLPSSSPGTTATNTVGLATAFDIFQHLMKAGYQVSYRRVPMSRERTPQASDLEQVLSQMAAVPPGKQPIYIFLSRTATGSSVRFATAAAATYIKWRESVELRALEMAHYTIHNGGGSNSHGNGNSGGGLNVGSSSSFSAGASPAGNSWGRNTGFAAARGARTGGTSGGTFSAEPSEDGGGGGGGPSSTRHTSHHPTRTSLQLPRTDSDVSELMRNVPAGEYRGIMNLCRVLPSGGEAKAAVDAAIEGSVAKNIGNLITDIYACKQATEEEIMTGSGSSSGGCGGSGMEAYFEKRYAARRLGIHYLKRYAFLIMFRVYLDRGLESGVNFTRFYEERRELKHLLSTLDLE